MTKGHNKGKNNSNRPAMKGQDRHLTNKEKKKELAGKGRNAEEDQSYGRKGKNSI
ncbi:MAG: hypothetical protein ACK40G_12025 [Cytophagaceae bacterium]